MSNLTLASLFDGSGGFPLAAVNNGITPIWASEIEPYPILVTKKNFPEMKHLGDINKVKGNEAEPADIITFGSPCFPAHTKILTEHGFKNIEDVSVSDLVYTHKNRLRKVVKTGFTPERRLWVLWANPLNPIRSTGNHPFYCKKKLNGDKYADADFIPVSKISVGDLVCYSADADHYSLTSETNQSGLIWVPVVSVSRTNEITTVYNIEVEEDHTYIAEDYVVHNCQDLSICGEREGLTGSRSSLFFEAIRIVKEMREQTNGQYPKYICFENVIGALSSHGGNDFRIILEEITKVKSPSAKIPLPRSERWEYAGEILGDKNFSIAWRVLDAQYSGVPQRRKRVFIVADYTGCGAGKILFESEGLGRHLAQSCGAGDRTSGNIEDGSGGNGEQRAISIDDVSNTLRATAGPPKTWADIRGSVILEKAIGFDGYNSAITGSVSSTLGTNCGMSTGRSSLICLNDQGGNSISVEKDEISPTLRAQTHGNLPVIVKPKYRPRRFTPLECGRLQGFPDDWCQNIDIPNPTEEDLLFWENVFETHRQIVDPDKKKKDRKTIIKWLKDPYKSSDTAQYTMWGNGIALPCVDYIMRGIAHYHEKGAEGNGIQK